MNMKCLLKNILVGSCLIVLMPFAYAASTLSLTLLNETTQKIYLNVSGSVNNDVIHCGNSSTNCSSYSTPIAAIGGRLNLYAPSGSYTLGVTINSDASCILQINFALDDFGAVTVTGNSFHIASGENKCSYGTTYSATGAGGNEIVVSNQ